MRLKIFMLCLVALFVSQTSRAQWVVTDPGNLAQGIINATKNIVHTSSTASTMIQNFQETVKIYRCTQGTADHPACGRHHRHLCEQLRAYA